MVCWPGYVQSCALKGAKDMRWIGVGLTGLTAEGDRQGDLFGADEHEKTARLGELPPILTFQSVVDALLPPGIDIESQCTGKCALPAVFISIGQA